MRRYGNFDPPPRNELVRIEFYEDGTKTDGRRVIEGLEKYIVKVLAPGPVKTLVLFVSGEKDMIYNRQLRNAQSDEIHVWND